MNTLKTTIGILVAASATFSATDSWAARVRTCNVTMVDTVVIVDKDHNIIASAFELQTRGTTAGRHGGVQANTARSRARDRFNDCRAKWIVNGQSASSIRGATPSGLISECDNSTARSSTGRDILELSGGGTYREYIGKLSKSEVCAFADLLDDTINLNELFVLATQNSSRTSGNNRCGSTRSNTFEQFIATLAQLCR